jgi:CO/xanthine dehydrogenase FAD-binding subunit
MEIAVASVALVLRTARGAVEAARIGYGSVAPIPMRGRKAETELVGKPLSAEVIEGCAKAAREEIAPISDVRAGEDFRRRIVGVMLRRMLEDAGAA